VGARLVAPGACILSDTRGIQVGLAEAEGVTHAVERGALQPQDLGGHHLIALGLGQRPAQQLTLEDLRGGVIRLGGGGGREERRGPEGRRQLLEGNLGTLAEDDGSRDMSRGLSEVLKTCLACWRRRKLPAG